jgi:alpha-N-acetylglucosamine transferase
MKLVFISGPYRANTEEEKQQNIAIAEEHSKRLWRMGYAVFCPHLNTKNFDGVCPEKYFLDGDLIMLRSCDYIYLLPCYEKSEGSRAELAEAQRLGIPVLEIDDGK